MDTDAFAIAGFQDDDAFLLKYLPGTANSLRKLRATIHSLNTENIDLVKFVLFVGPSGTGKNFVASVCAGHRRWLEIKKAKDELDPGKNCADRIAPLREYLDRFGEQMLPAIPEGLVESHLFGHVKGAFSGAVEDSVGLFRDKGFQDILLDEIGESPSFLQAKLLGILEGRPFTPVGGNSKHVTICEKRIFMATNRDLKKMVADHLFREDLFFRIRGFTISLPPLTANPEQIPDLAATILRRLAAKRFKGSHKLVPEISADDQNWLKGQRWDGNVRELKEVIELWLVAGCCPSIKEIAATRHFGGQATDEPVTTLVGNVSAVVRSKIDSIVAGRQKSPGTIDKFIKSFTADLHADLKAALIDWYRETSPSTETLRALFPETQTRSVRSQMSRMWRGHE